jgi:hypothetical protein
MNFVIHSFPFRLEDLLKDCAASILCEASSTSFSLKLKQLLLYCSQAIHPSGHDIDIIFTIKSLLSQFYVLMPHASEGNIGRTQSCHRNEAFL